MTSERLAQAYLTKARSRLKALAVLRDATAYDNAAWALALAERAVGRLARP